MESISVDGHISRALLAPFLFHCSCNELQSGLALFSLGDLVIIFPICIFIVMKFLDCMCSMSTHCFWTLLAEWPCCWCAGKSWWQGLCASKWYYCQEEQHLFANAR